MNRYIATVAAVAATLLTASASANDERRAPAAPTRPNILLIMADDLGYSDLGVFGGEIHTPNIDKLAASGRLMTNYYTGATCSPTRAMLMSGTDQHVAGLGSMAEYVGTLIARNKAPWGAEHQFGINNLPPGYEGYLNDNVLSLPQLLQDGGYHTYMAGKWHIALMPAEMPKPPMPPIPYTPRPASFPKAKGFERSFALLEGAGSHFAPVPGKLLPADLASTYVEDDRRVQLSPNFYSTVSYTDKLIEYLDASKGDGKPFFAYLAYTAPHWPLQAPDADIAKYATAYQDGYEAVRARRIAKQKALGLLPSDFHPNSGLDGKLGRPRWADLTAAQQATEARKMAVYAAMVDNMDRNVGRLIQYLKDTNRYDNTLIVFTSDNGAEGGPSQYPNTPETDNTLGNIGRPLSNVAYGERWAEVSATPFRLFKSISTEGGITAPMIVRWPGQMKANPVLSDRAHVSDLLPTFLEVAGVRNPGTHYQDREVKPITGLSLSRRLGGASPQAARAPDDVMAGELFDGRYVIRGQWKLVAIPAPYGDNRWQLFNLATDRGETTDVIDQHPDVASQLTAEYEAYAKRVGVVHAPASLGRGPTP